MILYNKSHRELLKQISEFSNFISTEKVCNQLQEIIESIYNISVQRVLFIYDIDIFNFQCPSLEIKCKTDRDMSSIVIFNDNHNIRCEKIGNIYVYVHIDDILRYLEKEDAKQLIDEIQTPTSESLEIRIDALEEKIDQLIDAYESGCNHDCSGHW